MAKSTAEAEYRSLSVATGELLWISYVLLFLGVPVVLPIPLYCDNATAIKLTQNPVCHERTKHLDIDCHFIPHHYRTGFVAPTSVSSRLQVADLFTKSVTPQNFKQNCSKLSLRLACWEDVEMFRIDLG